MHRRLCEHALVPHQDSEAQSGENRCQLAVGAEIPPQIANMIAYRLRADAEFLGYPKSAGPERHELHQFPTLGASVFS